MIGRTRMRSSIGSSRGRRRSWRGSCRRGRSKKTLKPATVESSKTSPNEPSWTKASTSRRMWRASSTTRSNKKAIVACGCRSRPIGLVALSVRVCTIVSPSIALLSFRGMISRWRGRWRRVGIGGTSPPRNTRSRATNASAASPRRCTKRKAKECTRWRCPPRSTCRRTCLWVRALRVPRIFWSRGSRPWCEDDELLKYYGGEAVGEAVFLLKYYFDSWRLGLYDVEIMTCDMIINIIYYWDYLLKIRKCNNL